MHQINDNAYRFELISFADSLFDNSIVAATYIIHLEGNGRYNNIIKQINKFKTTNKIFILHNKGYKKSIKPSFINTPPLDLIDAYLTIFKHSKNNNFKNILIFEDDFICDDKLLDRTIINNISSLINKKHDEIFIYYLGILPILLQKYNNEHFKLIYGIGTHSVIYNSNFIDETLNIDQKYITDWDLFLKGMTENLQNVKFSNNSYVYKECLCYQIFSRTENSKYWGKNTFNKDLLIFQQLIDFAIECVIKLLDISDMEHNPVDGFNLVYKLCIKI